MTAISPVGALARRFTVDWLDRADPAVTDELMTPDYRVHIGAVELDGREPYVSGTVGQLQLFPGLLLTVHELVTDGEQFALLFTEHGASARHEGRAAAWRGVALFRCADGRLAENWTQEDYASRRRQLADGVADPVGPPAVAPWTTAPQPADPAAEAAARAWLARPAQDGPVCFDDDSPLALTVSTVRVDRLFSAGPRVAFAATWSGTAADDRTAELGACGLLSVEDGTVTGGDVITDRHGLARALRG